MSERPWFFSLRFWPSPDKPDMTRVAVVGPARSSTVEAALHLARAPEDLRAKIRSDATVRKFVEGALDPTSNGYYMHSSMETTPEWIICIASVHEVIQ